MACRGCGLNQRPQNICGVQKYSAYNLSTTFTPLASCSYRFTPLAVTYSASVELYHDIYDQACYPPGPQGDWEQLACANSYGLTYISGPCPDGYTTHTRDISPTATATHSVFTTATCCFEGFSYTEVNDPLITFDGTTRASYLATKLCISYWSTLTILTMNYDKTFLSELPTPVKEFGKIRSFATSVHLVSETSAFSSGARYAAPIYLLGRSLDALVSTTRTTTASPGVTGGPERTGDGGASQGESDGPQNESTSGGLSNGARTGIGVGATTFLLLVGLGSFSMWRRALKKRIASQPKIEQPIEGGWTRPELDAQLEQRWPQELEATHQRQEIT